MYHLRCVRTSQKVCSVNKEEKKWQLQKNCHLAHGDVRYSVTSKKSRYQTGLSKRKGFINLLHVQILAKKGKRICEQMAAEWAAKKESEVLTARYVPPEDMTLKEACNKYIESRTGVLSPGTIREYKRSVKRDMAKLMPLNIMEITQEDVQAEMNREALTHSPKTVYNMHGFLSTVLKTYRSDFILRTSLPKKVRPKIYVPTSAEVKKVIECTVGSELEIPVLLAAFGPMRRSEICALNSDHIKQNIVHVEYAMVMNDSHGWVIKRPKSFAGDRFISYPGFVADKLKGIHGKITNLNPSQISDRFSDLLDDNQIHHFRFHDLRHYCASELHTLGIPDVYIMQRGGWEDDTTLKNVYRHVLVDREKEMNEIGNDYFSKLCNTKCNTKKESAEK
nr:MAG TPA: Integrase [Caudoviricetes sp.]